MQEIIDRRMKLALSAQISQKLINEIKAGTINPRKRIPGERKLAERFGVSRGTIIEALNLLEKQNYIERIPAKGTFINQDINHEFYPVKIIFPFSEAFFPSDSLKSMESWAAFSEVYRGMILEAKEQQAEIIFQYFEDTENQIIIHRQKRRLQDFDASIFIGGQLSGLRNAAINDNNYLVCIAPTKNYSKIVSTVTCEYAIVFDKMAEHLAEKGYRKLHILDVFNKTPSTGENEQKAITLHAIHAAAAKYGINVNPQWIYRASHLDICDTSRFITKSGWDMASRNEAIFCAYTEGVPLLYKYFIKNNIVLGRNIGMFGYASGITFNNLLPEFTYCKIDYLNIGRTACRIAINAIRNSNKRPLHKSVSAKLIVREST